MKITYIATCKGRLHHLARALPSAVAAGGADFIVVDYGCPDGTADWVARNHPEVKVVRVTDDPGFSAARARNLGAAQASTPWLGFFDADVVLAEGFFASVSPGLVPGHFFLPDTADPNTWGCCLVERAAFAAVGGYDEAIEGWGGEDTDLYEALSMRGLRRGSFPGALLAPIRHSDAERTRFHPEHGLDRAMRLNHVYRLMKHDVTRLTTRALGLEERRRLRAIAAELVERAGCAAPGEPVQAVEVVLPDRRLRTRPPRPEPERPRLATALAYTIAAYGTERESPQAENQDGPQSPSNTSQPSDARR